MILIDDLLCDRCRLRAGISPFGLGPHQPFYSLGHTIGLLLVFITSKLEIEHRLIISPGLFLNLVVCASDPERTHSNHSKI
jgi:hypothetical protein